MSRIEERFSQLNNERRKGFIPFVTAGDPDLATSLSIILKLAELGADVIELGVPFSDPMADGPTIQRSSQRSLEEGTHLQDVIDLAAEFRRSSEVPLVLFSYLNPILRYGVERFSKAAANAGVDMFMVPDKWKRFLDALRSLVQQGIVPLERIDDAVRRILTVKFTYGLFERPRPASRPWSNHASFGSQEHREVAREAVRKSLVLLKNRDAILPLSKNARILVAGKNAHNRGHQCGGFSIEWQGTSGNEAVVGGTSLWEGIREVAPAAVLSIDGSAAETQKFDVALVVIGEKPALGRSSRTWLQRRTPGTGSQALWQHAGIGRDPPRRLADDQANNRQRHTGRRGSNFGPALGGQSGA